ncbi:hypothetical protein TNCV_2379791 [Trichonephila clavipes]|uniref:Tc1-like transposase DDE domain-containing protein n=1 Tax=Trichonephila clavipes TaxID=2585209 RepID=A0A8X6UW09_TRICX|nr:hypothetical protein TNCV_2379791 [Trichonephila clavipes]
MLPLPGISPNLSPIENIWDIIKRQLQHPPQFSSHHTTPIHSPPNLSDRPGFGFVTSRSNKQRFISRIHSYRNQFNPPSF